MKRPRLLAAVLGAAAALFLSAFPAHASSLDVYFNIRYPAGNWQGFQETAQPPYGCCYAIADATDAENDTTHVDVVYDDGLWDNVRYSNGSWQGWQQPPQPPAVRNLNAFAETGDSDGTIWFVIDTTSGFFYDYRLPAGAWGSWQQISEPAAGIEHLAVAFDDVSYQVEVMASAYTGAIWHNVYTLSSKSWQGWRQPAQVPGGAASIAAASEVDGDVQYLAVNESGTVYHDIRYSDGSWQGWVKPDQPAYRGSFVPSSTYVSAAADENYNTQFALSDGSGTVYHTIRYTNGTWQSGGWSAISEASGSACFDVAVTTQTYRAPSDFYFAGDGSC
jgi:hypothetical protein